MSLKPFTIRSNVSQVPPYTPISNTGNSAEVEQYRIRPDKQFWKQNALSAAVALRNIASNQNFFISKIIFSGDFAISSTWLYVYLTSVATGATIGDNIVVTRLGTSSAVFKDNRNYDFDPPIYINTALGTVQLTLAQTGMAGADICQYTVFGFFSD